MEQITWEIDKYDENVWYGYISDGRGFFDYVIEKDGSSFVLFEADPNINSDNDIKLGRYDSLEITKLKAEQHESTR